MEKKTGGNDEGDSRVETQELESSPITPEKTKRGPHKVQHFMWGLTTSVLNWLKERPFYQRYSAVDDPEDKQYYEQKAQEDHASSRPPEGGRLEFRSIRLMELFQIEELERLQQGILSLFPGIKDDPNVKLRIQSFLKEAGDVFITDHSWKFGYVARTYLFYGMPFRKMTNLPEEVSHADIEVIKFTASSFALCIDVYLTDRAIEVVNELQEKKYYMPDVPFITRLKWAVLRKGYERQWSGRRQEVLKYFITLRSKIERMLPRYLRGHFLRQPRVKGEALLPAIEVFIIKGAPATNEELDNWIDETRGWWDSLGFDFIFAAFKSDVMFFNWALNPPWMRGVAHRLVFLHDAYVYRRHESLHKESSINFEFETHLDHLTPLIMVRHYNKLVRERVSNLKAVALQKMQLKWWSWFWPRMRHLIKLNNTIQQETMLMDRLSIEWGARAKRITDSKHIYANMGDLIAFKFLIASSEDERENLRDATLDLIDREIEALSNQLVHLRTWYAEHLASRNTWVTYGLTIVVGLATIVGLVSIRDDILSALNFLWHIRK